MLDVYDMLEILGLQLEDPGCNRFTNRFKRDILEQAQYKLANLLHNNYLTELEYVDESKTATGGVLNFSDLSYKVLKGNQGILKVKIHDGRYCTRLDIKDLRDTDSSYLEGTDSNPLFYVYDEKIYVLCTTTDPVIDVFYLKKPDPLYYPLKYTALSGSITEVIDFAGIAQYRSQGHGLTSGDVIQHSDFSVAAYNGEKTVDGIIDSDNYTTNDSYDTDDQGIFRGLRTVEIQSGQNLETSNDYYNGSLIYNLSKNSYHVVSDHTGRHIVFYPEISSPTDDEQIYFLRNVSKEVEITNLENVYPNLNGSLHQLMVDMAEAMCWKSGRDKAFVDRSKVALDNVLRQIKGLNEKIAGGANNGR